MNNKGADQTPWMHRLVCTFLVYMQQNQFYSRQEIIFNLELKKWKSTFAHVHFRGFISTCTSINVKSILIAYSSFLIKWHLLLATVVNINLLLQIQIENLGTAETHWIGGNRKR